MKEKKRKKQDDGIQQVMKNTRKCHFCGVDRPHTPKTELQQMMVLLFNELAK